MAKNPENYNPFQEEHHAEQERLYGKDKQHAYVPIEQVADTDPGVQEEGESDYYKDQALEQESDRERAYKADLLKQEIQSKKINFNQGEGVVSVGPDVEESREEIPSITTDTVGTLEEAKEQFLKSRRKTSKQISSMSPSQVTRESRSYTKINKRDGRQENENLKTQSEEKKSRSLRQRIRDFFTIQNYKETPEHKAEEIIESGIEDFDDNEILLNGRPIDKKLLEDTNKAA